MIAFVIAVLLTGNTLAFGGEISDYYDNKHELGELGLGGDPRGHRQTAYSAHGITEIGIQRTGCHGTCPSYSFTIKNDGTYRYRGFAYVERKGEFSGTIRVWHFDNLAQFIKESGYMELGETYSPAAAITDQPTTYTPVVMNGKRKTIKDYAESGPTSLWAIQQLIDDLMDKAKWDSSEKAPSKK